MFANSGGFGSLGRLVAEAQTPLRTVELDVLNEDNAGIYWSRDSRYDTVLNLNFAGAGLDALCRVLERWIAHLRHRRLHPAGADDHRRALDLASRAGDRKRKR